VLEALGVKLALAPRDVEDCIAEVGIGFLFAPLLHGAMKHAVGPRREIGVRTIFNILGPLTNPAGAQRLLIGVFADHYAALMAQALQRLGAEEAMVVHGHGGLDEIALSGPTKVYHLRAGKVEPYEIDPADYGLEKCGVEELAGGEPEENAAIIREVLAGRPGPRRDVVLLNAAATIAVAGAAEGIPDGLEAARRSIDGGAAQGVLERWVSFSTERGRAD
jgi:anthranilate phosphoribosyltransferase